MTLMGTLTEFRGAVFLCEIITILQWLFLTCNRINNTSKMLIKKRLKAKQTDKTYKRKHKESKLQKKMFH